MISRKLRSWLTILGVIIGVAAIVSLISIGQGLRLSVDDQLSNFGTNTIIVVPGESSGPIGPSASSGLLVSKGKLWVNDAERLGSISGVKLVSKGISVNTATITFKRGTFRSSVRGADPLSFEDAFPGVSIAKGREFENNDQHVALIGHNVAYDYFDEVVNINSKLIINGQTFKVIGILDKMGSSPMSQDSTIMIPIDDAKEMTDDILLDNELSTIIIVLDDDQDIGEIEELISFELRSAHKVAEGEEDFTLISANFINAQAGSIVGYIELFLGSVAGISLVVGGVGIANTMYMSVMERTKEIGILKAIGAKENSILELFLIESSIIGGIGGLIGLIIGMILSLILTLISSAVGMQLATYVSIELAIGAVLFSMIVGLLSGYLPAKKAALLNTVDALRYE